MFRFHFLALVVTSLLFSTTVAFMATSPPMNVLDIARTERTSSLFGKADDMTEEEYAVAMEKATIAMTKFTNRYLKNSETTLCTDKSVPAAVIKGLAEHKVNLGAPLCPCRFYEDKEAEVKDGYWNCPCVPMREEKVCHCCLFLTEDNPFAGKDQVSRNCCFDFSLSLQLHLYDKLSNVL